jgi:hypothetical protein
MDTEHEELAGKFQASVKVKEKLAVKGAEPFP